MVIGVDDLLEAAAVAAAEELAKDIVDETFKAIFGDLATAQQLSDAVTAIEAYVQQQKWDLEDDTLAVQCLAAMDLVQRYVPGDGLLTPIFADLAQASGWIQQQTQPPPTYQGEDLLRLLYVRIVQYAVINATAGVAEVAETGNAGRKTLFASVNESIDVLTRASNQIKLMEDFGMTKINAWIQQVRTRNNEGEGGPPQWNVSYNACANYRIYKGAYPGGFIQTPDIVVDGSQNVADVIAKIQPAYDADEVRCTNDNAQRAALIYNPIAAYVASLIQLKARYVTAALQKNDELRAQRGMMSLAELDRNLSMDLRTSKKPPAAKKVTEKR